MRRGLAQPLRRMRPPGQLTGDANEVLAEDLRADSLRDADGGATPARALPPLSKEQLQELRIAELERLVANSQATLARVQEQLRVVGRGRKDERTTALLRAKTDLLIVEEALGRGRLGPAKDKIAAGAAGASNGQA